MQYPATHDNRLSLLKEAPDSVSRDHAGSQSRPEEDHGPDRLNIVCRNCRIPITSDRQRTVVMGGHRHVFFNPAGDVFEIGCFGYGRNLAPVGTPTLEFTWFAGHSWQVLLCAGCGVQLGWKYASAHSAFYGLILPLLDEEKGSQ